jgi:hypothetical protein
MTIISQFSTPPSRSDPANFAARADVYHSELPTRVTQMNAVASEINADKTTTVNAINAAFAAGLATAASNAATATTQAASATTQAGIASAASSAAQAAWTAALSANPDLNPAIRMNPATVSADTTIPSGYNAYSSGPIVISEGVTVTVQDGGRWSVF